MCCGCSGSCASTGPITSTSTTRWSCHRCLPIRCCSCSASHCCSDCCTWRAALANFKARWQKPCWSGKPVVRCRKRVVEFAAQRCDQPPRRRLRRARRQRPSQHAQILLPAELVDHVFALFALERFAEHCVQRIMCLSRGTRTRGIECERAQQFDLQQQASTAPT